MWFHLKVCELHKNYCAKRKLQKILAKCGPTLTTRL